MRYLLDTCVVSDFIKGESGTQVRLKQTLPADIAVSSITVMELRYGLALNPQRAQKVKPTISSFLTSVTILPFTTTEAEQAARIRAILKSQGQPIGAYDVLIAATALQHHLFIVTANQREFDLDLSQAKYPGYEQQQIDVDFPAWMIAALDQEARRLGVTCQSIIKVWIGDRLANLPR